MSEIKELLVLRSTVPATLPVDVGGAIVDRGRVAAYRLAKDGVLPILPGRGRKRVITAKLEMLLGRRITIEDVSAAEKAVQPKRDAAKKYMGEYRAHRARLATKKASKQSGSGGPQTKKVLPNAQNAV